MFSIGMVNEQLNVRLGEKARMYMYQRTLALVLWHALSSGPAIFHHHCRLFARTWALQFPFTLTPFSFVQGDKSEMRAALALLNDPIVSIRIVIS